VSKIVKTVLSTAEDSSLNQPDANHRAGAALAALAMDHYDIFLISKMTTYFCHNYTNKIAMIKTVQLEQFFSTFYW